MSILSIYLNRYHRNIHNNHTKKVDIAMKHCCRCHDMCIKIRLSGQDTAQLWPWNRPRRGCVSAADYGAATIVCEVHEIRSLKKVVLQQHNLHETR